MSHTRRNMLRILGGGSILAAAGAGSFLATRTPTKALAPWASAGGYSEPRRRALSYAILAPNPHNRQPWLVDLSRDNHIRLTVDTNKLLPHTDPFSRQITIGLGCFLELLRMAAAQDGYLATITGFPQGEMPDQLDQRPVADITLVKDANVEKDPLFAYVLERRSLKEPFDLKQQVPHSVLSDLASSVKNGTKIGATNDVDTVAAIRGLAHEAMAIEIETPRTYQESVDLFRIGKSEINANPDGLDFGGPLFDTLAITGLFSREAALNANSPVYTQGIDAVMANVDTAMGFVWLTTKGNSRLDQLAVGADWLRVNLATTQTGIGLQPLSQALQEYDEMKTHYSAIHELLNASGDTVQMLGRLGYAEQIPPSPRWPLDAAIIKV